MQRYLTGDFMNTRYLTHVLYCLLSITAAFSLNMFYSGRASGSEKTDILAVGEGRIKDYNMADARKEAISNALKKGMEQYLSQYLGSKGMAGNFTTLINNIVPSSIEDIENYHILAEDRKDETFSILMRIKVNEKLMEERLKQIGIVRIEATSIKILFLVSEKTTEKERSFWWNNPEGTPALTTTELKLYNIFQEKGMETINRLSNTPSLTYSDDMRKPDLSNDAATKWGRMYSADVIIKGGCNSTAGNMVTVDLEAIKVEDGVSICRAGSEEYMNPVEAVEERFMNALDRAINNIAVQFGPQIIKALGKTDGESNKIDITLKDAINYEEVRVFKKFLEDEIGGIKSVVQSRIKGNSITMSVEFFGVRDAFINKLKASKKFTVQADITDAEGGSLVIAIEHEMMDPITSENVNIQ
jgi:hypothetical protein